MLRDPAQPELGGPRGVLHVHLQTPGETFQANLIPELPAPELCAETKKNERPVLYGEGGGGRR